MDRTSDRGSGQAVLEFALVIPLVVLLVMMLFDASRAVIYYTELSNASRVGARVAMVNQSHDASCAGAAETYRCAAADVAVATDLTPASIPLVGFVDTNGDAVTVHGEACSVYGSCFATLTLDYSFDAITPLVGNIVGPIQLSATTTMPIERRHSNP